jgi:heme/copper-type cytochrome/quinol oxidase subunit 3
MFLGFQFIEYEYYASFDIDNIYGTVFYMLTLLHGAHVFVGVFLLLVCFSLFMGIPYDENTGRDEN